MKQQDLKTWREIAIVEFTPHHMMIMLWVTFSFAVLTTCMPAIFVTLVSEEASLLSNGLVKTGLVVLVIHLLVSFYFSSKKRAYRHQKALSVFTVVFLFKSSLDLYLLYFLVNDVKNLPQVNWSIGLGLLLTGVAFLVIMCLLRLKGVRLQDTFYLEDMNEHKLITFRRPSNTRRVLNYTGYILFITIAWEVAQRTGLLAEGYTLAILYHAAIVQYVVALRFSKGIIVAVLKLRKPEFTVTDATYEKFKVREETAKPKIAGVAQRLLVALLQFLLLAVLSICAAYITFEPLKASGLSFYGLCYFLLLKWIAKDGKAYAGTYFINAMLMVASFLIILRFIVFITGVEETGGREALMFFSVSMFPLLFWWCFDFFGFIKNK